MTRLSARDRKALSLGAVVLISGILLTRGLPSWRSALVQAQDEAALEQRALADARALIKVLPALRDSLEQRRGRLDALTPRLIKEANAHVAVARLEAVVSAAAASAGIVVSSLGLRADSSGARALRRPQVHGEARGDASGLLQFLLLLELGPPLVRVPTLTITQPDPIGRSGRPEELRIAFIVEGASLVPNAPTSRDARP